ncbi:MAG: dihydroorotase [Formosa sp.]|jgi:dihydroorotase|nr:dihydroorotase [Formosa sp.]MDG1375158.1 dihydroorotase [Flavobacteriaceae bacterium]
MNVLIKSATILDDKSDFHYQTQDILVENGFITQIAKSLKNPKKYPVIELENLHVSSGWFDSSVSFGEPGYEERETIANGLQVAAASGFTDIALNANTNPVIDSHSDIAYVKSKAINSATNLHPIGALTKASEGIDLAELFDMKSAGSIAFGDYKKPIKNPNLLKIALQYASSFDGLVHSFPHESRVAKKGVMNENIMSTRLGLKGLPAMAEELQIARDLFLLEYTEGKLHIPTLSTAKSVALVREAKAKKLDVSCSVAIHNLMFTDESLSDFDTNFKVNPPLRTQYDIEALIAGVKDGTIDMVTSDHNPIDIEYKKIEFDYAKNGTLGLESAFGALNTLFTTKKAIQILTKGKQRFGLKAGSIKIGSSAQLSLFNPSEPYVFKDKHIQSKSKNSLFLGTKLKGKVYGVIANNTTSIAL